MKIVIVGDGKIGRTLAEQLYREGHDITVIDSNSAALEQTSQDLDILCVEGNGATHATQLEAGVDSADLLIAATDSDEVNLLCCLIAKKVGAKHTIARVRNPEYDDELSMISGDLGLSLSVNPELSCASAIARTLRMPSAIKTDTFAGGKVDLLKFQLPKDSQIVGKKLMELPGLIKAKVLICAVERGENEVFIPTGQFQLEAGDRISFVASPRDAQAFFRQARLFAGRIRSVMLVGGGRIAYYLTRQLLDAGMDVSIIESNPDRCEQLSALLPKAEILHGDGTNEAFLREAGIENVDAFAALTGIDEENVLMGMYVRKSWPKIKVITKLNRYSFKTILETMDLGSVFNPRYTTSDLICSYVRSMQNSVGSKIETLYKLVGGKVEAVEFRVAEGSPVCGIPLAQMERKKGLLIGCIIRGRQVIIPNGQDTIEPGDAVIVVSSVTGLQDLGDILASHSRG